MIVLRPLAQTLLMVVASEVTGMPAPRAACRAGDWPTPAFGGRYGAVHGLDVSGSFREAREGNDMLRVADQLSSCWVAFARTGNPNNPRIPPWPVFDASTRATINGTRKAGRTWLASSNGPTASALWVWSKTATDRATKPNHVPRRLTV